MGAAAESGLDHTANLLGTLALAVTDRIFDGVAEAGASGTTAVGLSALHQFPDRPTIDVLRRMLGLTSSGAVRLVDRLEAAGWVRRGPAPDGRATAVLLTADGRRVARRVTATRTEVLKRALSTLSEGQLRAFEELTSLLLVGLMPDPGTVRWLCRFCDLDACGFSVGHCPVRNAARGRAGADSRVRGLDSGRRKRTRGHQRTLPSS